MPILELYRMVTFSLLQENLVRPESKLLVAVCAGLWALCLSGYEA